MRILSLASLVQLFCAITAVTTTTKERKVLRDAQQSVDANTDPEGNSESPWYYHGLDGPTFKNYSVDSIEIREYPAQLWVATDVEATNFDVAQNKGFDLLFDYISGENEEKVAIDMTTPVLTFVTPGTGPNCATLFTVSFFVPYEYQTPEGPPSPTNDAVYIKSIGPLTVGVDEFSGYALEPEIVARTAALSSAVEDAQGVSLDRSEEFIDKWWEAGYDPPFRVTGRHNEVWVPVIVE